MRQKYIPDMDDVIAAVPIQVHNISRELLYDKSLRGIDLYLSSNIFSGTHLHNHGTVITTTTGRKLWLLYSPEDMCRLEKEEGQKALRRAGLPPLCRVGGAPGTRHIRFIKMRQSAWGICIPSRFCGTCPTWPFTVSLHSCSYKSQGKC